MTYPPGLRPLLSLGLRALAVLAIVAASTAVLVAPEHAHSPLLTTAIALGHG